MAEPAPSTAPLRVVLVDPDECVRESLSGLLGIGDRCVVVGSAGTADAAVRLASDVAPDVFVIDPRLPGIDAGAALIARLREVLPTTRVLVLNWSGAGGQECGADAYARKTFRPHELIDAVVSVSRPSVT